MQQVTDDELAALRAEVAALRDTLAAHLAAHASRPTPDASTATANQTYTWLPGDVWTQYCAAVDG